LLKKLAILAVAVLWLAANTVHPEDTDASRTKQPAKPSIHASSSVRSAPKRRTSAQKGKVQVARGRRAQRAGTRSPWRISSYGEPTAEDNPAGEDPGIRQAAIEALGNWNGSIVVVDPNTGRILSIVNQKMALSSAFTPCSTFKPVVALAALKEDIITPETTFYVGRRQRMNLTEALARSNNIFFSKLGEMLGFRRLAHYAREFGYGQKAGANIPGESPGRFPSAPPKEGGVGYLAYYGQDIEVTPLQMAAVISAIANGGTLYELQYPRASEELAQFKPKVRRRLDALAQYLPQIKDGLAAAVIYGTARLAYDPEVQIYGKTGTCNEDGARLGWFVSYAEGQQPKYVVVVFLRGGRLMYGSRAAEIGGRLHRELYLRARSATQASHATSPFLPSQP
jgi:penicillin-binding protein 2